MKKQTNRSALPCQCDGCKTLHALFCRDPDCPEGVCRAARFWNMVRAGRLPVQVIDSAENVRLFFGARLPLDRLLECTCVGCDGRLFVTAGQLVAFEREHGEPVALLCKQCSTGGATR